MKKKTLSWILLMAVMAVGMLGGCRTGEEDGGKTMSAEHSESDNVVKEELLIAAAASLEYSFEEELIPMFEEENPGITVKGTYDSSGKLQTQIEEGIPADLFVSAATKQMDALAEQSLVEKDSVVDLLENEIVLITAADSKLELKEFSDITAADIIAIGDPESVPVGQYARESLTNLGIWEEVAARASFGTNVTEVLNWVAEGSADAGIVYATDAATTDQVRVAAKAPEDSLAEAAIYPAGMIAASKHKTSAEKFLKFLQTDEAAAVFEEYGFQVIEK